MSLKLVPTTPKKSLNAAFLKVRPLRSEIDIFKANLITLLDKVDESEREENQKNHVRDFLANTYYKGKNEINTKGTIDLVIHTDQSNKSSVGVIIEAKRPSNKSEWISPDKPNSKAFQELVLYYLRERIDEQNIDIKNIILTNIYEWYIIDAAYFDKVFYQNKELVRSYKEWRDGQKVTSDTSLFYNDIAFPFLDNLQEEMPCTYFDIRTYEKELRNQDKGDDIKLIELQKLLSQFHLLKVPFANDSNSLDKRFYGELLHIIGLTETKDGSKKLIGRHKAGERHTGTILEDSIIQLDVHDKLSRLQNVNQYGKTTEEKLFNVALELTITWVNRILFLKLLEGQLLSYHRGDKSYLFLNIKTIKEFDQLDALFFQVLARKYEDRNEHVKDKFQQVPYLNSSLFEPTDLEHDTILISNLSDDKTIPVYAQTVLKDHNGNKKSGHLSTLEYLFAFLDAYDFSSEGSTDIQEDNKTLINASVLGLIFEKINGYKDGSFFTPGFITMYMCRETIRKAVVQKFNETKGWLCTTTEELYDKIEDRYEANDIVNSLKICDPAVGSGHFLVSALNEMIAVKNDLKILQDRNGKRLKEYDIQILNDELIIRDEDGDPFKYNPSNKESQRIQETLFHEKQTLIENCLFGVDINPNSVKICRLRLWIELLKNAYYISNDLNQGQAALETLPNIDINIKVGNSLISRFAIDADIKDVLKNNKKWDIRSYRMAIDGYRNAKSKEEKRELESLINVIKNDFKSVVDRPFMKKISDARGKAEKLAIEITNLTAFGQKIDKKLVKSHEDAVDRLVKLEIERDDIHHNKIYENAFEWRFEFPEVLSDDGDFVGFDVVIGNPPYIRQEEFSEIKAYLKSKYEIYHSIADLLTYFVELSYNILNSDGTFQFIISNKFTRADYGKVMRQYLLDKTTLTHFFDFSGIPVFDEATVDAAILGFSKNIREKTDFKYLNVERDNVEINNFENFATLNQRSIDQSILNDSPWSFQSNDVLILKERVESQGVALKDWDIKINYGIKTGLNEAFVIDTKTKDQLIASDPKSAEIIKPMVRGRDIQKFSVDFGDQWLVYLPWHFPNHTVENNLDFIANEEVFKIEYSAIYNHMVNYKAQLEQRNKAETGIRYEWYALQRFGSNYWEDFEKPKIIYPVMTKFLNFAFDEQGYYGNDKIFSLLGEQIEWLVCFFNSKLWAYCFRDNFPELLGGTRELRKVFMEEIKIKKVDDDILEKCKAF
ncbi:MAG TPA: Eco57I restriction-modification methylase domain-containing protein, partial [Saprospiraceae bacterium]|nr:Eco57I restriction-modification methylase domain-containing protein [Saprospiraceae bacterium]